MYVNISPEAIKDVHVKRICVFKKTKTNLNFFSMFSTHERKLLRFPLILPKSIAFRQLSEMNCLH